MNEAELIELRQGRGFTQLWDHCLRYVLSYRGYGRILSRQDGEDIVSEAIAEELGSILNPDLDAEEVSIRLARALNRNRSVAARHAKVQVSAAPDPAKREDPILAVYYKDTARDFRGFLGQAIDRLSSRDRNLLIDQYRLERFGLKKQGASPEFDTKGSKKVAEFRARERFSKELNILLVQALAEGHCPDLIRGVRVLVQSRGLATPVSRKNPPTDD